MKDKLPLLIITLFLILLGGSVLILYFVNLKDYPCEYDGKRYKIEEVIEKYREGYTCKCDEGGEVACQEDNPTTTSKKPIQFEEFTDKNLEFEYEFISDISEGDISGFVKDLKLSSTEYLNNNLSLVFENIQKCEQKDDDKTPAKQAGFYYFKDNRLVLTSLINTAAVEDKGSDCIVELAYDIEDIKLSNLKPFALHFQVEEEIVEIPVCFYNNLIYSNGDTFPAEDECNICDCAGGKVTCTEQVKCEDSDQDSNSDK